MNETVITVCGNLTADPELRTIPSGKVVVNFTIASTARSFDRQANEWKDGDTLFLGCSVWDEFAQNIAHSLSKGTRVIAQGRLRERKFQDNAGNNRSVFELQVDDIGASLRRATVQVTRSQGGSGGVSARSGAGMGDGSGWAVVEPQNGVQGFEGGFDSGTPF